MRPPPPARPFDRGRRRGWLGHLRVAAPVALLTSACSLVSGWSDLQTETGRSQTPRDAATDSRLPPIVTPGDDGGAPTTDVGPTARGIDCGGMICPAGSGCCDDGDTRRCRDEVSCDEEQGGTWVTCDSQAFCAGQARSICCYHDGRDVLTCEATCEGGLTNPICGPGEPCPNGQQCLPGVVGATNLSRCF
jgi:hypothetical protein